MILASLKEGYKIPLRSWPPESALPHSMSARDSKFQDFLDEDLKLLEAIGAIFEVAVRPHLCLLLQVSDPPVPRWRMIVDTSRQLNKFIEDFKVKHQEQARLHPRFQA